VMEAVAARTAVACPSSTLPPRGCQMGAKAAATTSVSPIELEKEHHLQWGTPPFTVVASAGGQT
jgi:hypothetical protein